MSDPQNDAPNRFELSRDDRERISRLHEEIQERLEELAGIGARASGFELTPDLVRKFDPKPARLQEAAAPTEIEIVCRPTDGECGCIVLMDDGNHFWEMPCGSGGP